MTARRSPPRTSPSRCMLLKEKGHPNLVAGDPRDGEGGGRRRRDGGGDAFRQADRATRSSTVAGLPIFSKAYYTAHDFDAVDARRRRSAPAPTRSAASSAGRFIEYERVADYWGKDLPVNVGHEQFRRDPHRLLHRAADGVRGLQEGRDHLPRGVHLAHLGAGLQFPGDRPGGKVQEVAVPEREAPVAPGLVLQHPARKVPRPAHAAGDRPRLRFRMVEPQPVLRFLHAAGLVFREVGLRRRRARRRRRSWRCSSRSAPSCRRRCSARPMCRRRATARAATASSSARRPSCSPPPAGSQIGNQVVDEEGAPLEVEFLIDAAVFERVLAPFVANLKLIGIDAAIRQVDPAQYAVAAERLRLRRGRCSR